MSMEGRRFGVGLVAGILFGVVIIAGANGLGSSLVRLAPYESAGAQVTTNSMTTSTSVYLTVTSASTVPTSSGNSSVQSAVGSNSTGTAKAAATTSTTNLSSGGLTSYVGTNALPSASFAAISAQGAESNAFLVIPLILAVVFGAAIYRASTRPNGSEED